MIPEVLAEELHELYQNRDAGCDLVFHDHGQPLIRKTVALAYKRSLLACGIDYVSGTHLMRKTSATQANRMTGDLMAVSSNLGHSSLQQTTKYVEEIDDGKRKVAKALDEVARFAIQTPA